MKKPAPRKRLKKKPSRMPVRRLAKKPAQKKKPRRKPIRLLC